MDQEKLNKAQLEKYILGLIKLAKQNFFDKKKALEYLEIASIHIKEYIRKYPN